MLLCSPSPALQAAAATPDRWTQKITTNKLACTDHPTDYPPPALSYTGHGFLTAVPDPAIVFTVTPLAHAALALPLCLQTGQESGAIFDVQVRAVDMAVKPQYGGWCQSSQHAGGRMLS